MIRTITKGDAEPISGNLWLKFGSLSKICAFIMFFWSALYQAE